MRVTELDLLAELKKIALIEEDTTGWNSPAHYQKEWGLGERRTHDYLKLAVEEGKLEKRKFKKAGRPLPFYRAP